MGTGYVLSLGERFLLCLHFQHQLLVVFEQQFGSIPQVSPFQHLNVIPLANQFFFLPLLHLVMTGETVSFLKS